MITEQQLRQVFAPISGDQALRVCKTLSGNINTILQIEVGDHCSGPRLYGLRIRTQEHVYRYEPDLIKEVFISWLLDPDNSEKNDAEKATALARILTEKQGVGRNGNGIEPNGLAFDWTRQCLPHPYFVYEWIDGEPLWNQPTPQLYFLAGQALASIHSVRFEAFYADFLALGKIPAHWPHRFRAALDKEVANAQGRLSDSLTVALETISIPSSTPYSPCLIHNDFSPGNILVQDGHLTAVIDWDNAVVDAAPLDFVKMKYWTAKDPWGQLRHDPDLFRAFVDGYGPSGTEIVQSEIFVLYETLWLLRVFNFEISKQERGLDRAPGYPEAAVYAKFLTEVIDRLTHSRESPVSPPQSRLSTYEST